jgi:hypothetical protein
VTTFVYYLKWNDRWFREHADAELAATRYKADIYRASWLAELVLEAQTEADAELPPELIAAFGRNLFVDPGPTKESEHPIEAISSLVKRVRSVTVGKGGFSVEGVPESSRHAKERRAPKRHRKRDTTPSGQAPDA